MLNKVEIYSSLQVAPELTIVDESSPIEMDIVQVKDIQGLDPVSASINTIDSGSRDGVVPVGTSVPARNIVMILRPNPDFSNWTFEKIRTLLFSYFIPKSTIRLVFDNDETGTVEIFGTVESCEANPFSKDPEYIVSIVCPDPYFTAIDETEVDGSIGSSGDWDSVKTNISLVGNIPIGFKVRIPTGYLTNLTVQVGDPLTSSFKLAYDATSLGDPIFEISTVPGKKYVRFIDTVTGGITNILRGITDESVWPFLKPGDNDFAVLSDDYGTPGPDWTLTYFERFGGI